MKTYYIQEKELEILKIRLETLEGKLLILLSNITKCTARLKEVMTDGGKHENDSMEKYIIEKEQVKQEIEVRKQEIELLETNLKRMENVLKQMNGMEEEIFVLAHIQGKKPQEIANKIPCDLSTVYRYLQKINQTLKTCKKMQKI